MQRISRIEIEKDDVTFFFEDDVLQPFSISEFVQSSRTRVALEKIEGAILDFNYHIVKGGEPDGR